MIKIYTDGSSIGNPWPWWWAVLVLPEKEDKMVEKKSEKSLGVMRQNALVGAGSVAGTQTELFQVPTQSSVFSDQQKQIHTLQDTHIKKYPKKTGVGEAISLSWFATYTTNNRMELTAVVSAYLYIQQEKFSDQDITIYMDSKYVHDGLEVYLDQRIARWRRLANKKPVLNVDLRKQLYELKTLFPQIQIDRVKAHHTDKYNNFVDRLARKEANV